MNIPKALANLDQMTTAELAAEYRNLFGRPPRYRNPTWLKKRISYKLQEIQYGGLTRAALAELEALAGDIELPEAPTRANVRRDAKKPGTELRPGTVLTREWRGREIRVQVTADGFEWDGETYGSLSAAARAITGSRWNGKLFFGLVKRA